MNKNQNINKGKQPNSNIFFCNSMLFDVGIIVYFLFVTLLPKRPLLLFLFLLYQLMLENKKYCYLPFMDIFVSV